MRIRKYSHSYFSYAVLFALCMVPLLTEYLTEFNFRASIPEVRQWIIRLGSCCAILGSVFCLDGIFREHRRRVLMVRRVGTSEKDMNSNSIDASRLLLMFRSPPRA